MPKPTEQQANKSSNDLLMSLEGIAFSSGDKVILRDIDLELHTKTITTIIGPNGAGKSTLVKIISQLLQPNSGKLVKHQAITYGYVPQKLSIDASMPMKVSRFMSLANTTKQSYNDALSQLGIDHLRSQQLQDLSGGELQRVLLARAIARQPNVLVLDEPLQGVDVTGQIELYQLIARLRDQIGCAIVMVSHDLHLVMAQTDNVVCLNQHVCCHGKPDNVSKHPEYLKLFGTKAAENIAVYTHHHDHHHDMHGNQVDCDKGCDHA